VESVWFPITMGNAINLDGVNAQMPDDLRWEDINDELYIRLGLLSTDNAFLVCTAPLGRYVQYLHANEDQLLAEVSSNAFLSGEGRLSEGQCQAIRELGFEVGLNTSEGELLNFAGIYDQDEAGYALAAQEAVAIMRDVLAALPQDIHMQDEMDEAEEFSSRVQRILQGDYRTITPADGQDFLYGFDFR
jgi:hypothetical protein